MDLEQGARRNGRCALSAALVSKAAFILRKHSQNRKQAAAQTKPKNTPVGSSGKESVSLKWIFRVGWERCVLKPAAMSNIEGWSIRQSAVSAPCLSHPHTPRALFLHPHLQLPCCSSPWRGDPSIRCHGAHSEGERWRSGHALVWLGMLEDSGIKDC